MNRPPNKRQLQYQATLERLRDAVDTLVKEVGFDEMRIRDICSLAGISPGAFYHYFASKNELLHDRFVRANEQFLAYYEEKLVHMNEVDALLDYLDYFTEYTRSRVIGVLIQYHKTKIDFYQKWTLTETDEILDTPRKLVSKGIEAGTISSPYSQDQLVGFILAYLSGLGSEHILSHGEYLQKYPDQQIFRDWINALRPPSGAAL